MSLSEYKDYPVVYKTNYNFTCSSGPESIAFNKDSKFAPVSLGGELFDVEGVQMPKDTLGLKVYQAPGAPWYILIYPDGNFAVDQPIVIYMTIGFLTPGYICDNSNKVPFSIIQNK